MRVGRFSTSRPTATTAVYTRPGERRTLLVSALEESYARIVGQSHHHQSSPGARGPLALGWRGDCGRDIAHGILRSRRSARLGGSDVRRAVLRVVIGGALGLAFTYGVGHLFGTAIG